MKPRSDFLRLLEQPFRVSSTARKFLAISHSDEYADRRKDHLDDARFGTLDNNGVNVAYYEYGPEDSDISIVFIHGYTLGAVAYHRQVSYLRRLFPQVKLVLVDLRGHGRSQRVKVEACEIDLAAEDVIEVIKQRIPHNPFIIVGHSLGGPVSLSVVRRVPEEVHSRLVGLVEVSTTIDEIAQAGLSRVLNTRFMRNVVRNYRNQPEAVSAAKRALRKLIPHILSVFFFMRDVDESHIEFHASLIADAPPETLIGFLDDFCDHQEIEAATRLKGIPGFVICGDRDVFTPLDQSLRILEFWPDAFFQVAHNAGHMLPLEVPNIVNLAIRGLLLKNGVEESPVA